MMSSFWEKFSKVYQVGFAIFFLIFIAWAYTLIMDGPIPPYMKEVFIFWFVFYVLFIFLHEAAHMVAADIVGWKVKSLWIGLMAFVVDIEPRDIEDYKKAWKFTFVALAPLLIVVPILMGAINSGSWWWLFFCGMLAFGSIGDVIAIIYYRYKWRKVDRDPRRFDNIAKYQTASMYHVGLYPKVVIPLRDWDGPPIKYPWYKPSKMMLWWRKRQSMKEVKDE